MLKAGAFRMVVATLLFALVGAVVKFASGKVSDEQVVFARNAFGLLALAPLVLREGPRNLRTRNFRHHVSRALLGLAAMYCSFYSIARLPLADALLLNYTAPLFMPILAKLWLAEPIPPGLWRVLALGFSGVLVVLRPGAGLFHSAALVALLAGFLAAAAQVGIRRLTLTEPTVRIVFYFGLISTVISAAPAALAWKHASVSLWTLLVLMGAIATVAQLFLTRAYRAAPAAQVGPFIYTAVIFAGLLDWLLWRRLPDAFFYVGAALVVTAGVLVIKRMSSVAAAQEVPVKQ